ncbi:unnamed protein product [Phytophthora lilii]|uniref:Unnamed protein product n=1 Tax=Phytophthora lilii TaxID=2077276 RepID=A0A9W6U9D8_9STRA|nr:unnamed protein product [Phytophthora lilii]
MMPGAAPAAAAAAAGGMLPPHLAAAPPSEDAIQQLMRLELLEHYCNTTSRTHVFLVCMLTPLPVLGVAILLEYISLDPPPEGWAANWMFWIRLSLMVFALTIAGFPQMNSFIPGLDFTFTKMFIASIGITAAQTGTYLLESVVFGFPVPFMWQFGAITMAVYAPVVIRLHIQTKNELSSGASRATGLLATVLRVARNPNAFQIALLDDVRLWASPPNLIPEQLNTRMQALGDSGVYGPTGTPSNRAASIITKAKRHQTRPWGCFRVSVAPDAKQVFLKRQEADIDPQRSKEIVIQGLQLLFHCEYLALVEYVECIVPLMFVVYKSILEQLPHVVYYPGGSGKLGHECGDKSDNVCGIGNRVTYFTALIFPTKVCVLTASPACFCFRDTTLSSTDKPVFGDNFLIAISTRISRIMLPQQTKLDKQGTAPLATRVKRSKCVAVIATDAAEYVAIAVSVVLTVIESRSVASCTYTHLMFSRHPVKTWHHEHVSLSDVAQDYYWNLSVVPSKHLASWRYEEKVESRILDSSRRSW